MEYLNKTVGIWRLFEARCYGNGEISEKIHRLTHGFCYIARQTMDADEREIYYYLKSRRNLFLSAREICRHAGGKNRFRKEPEWAKPVLIRMAEHREEIQVELEALKETIRNLHTNTQ